jgi:enamine deaminase RidA (YjgF/YER057c/UK114 family)
MTDQFDPQARLAELGIELPPAPQPNATYVPTTQAGDVLYVSGQIAFDEHGRVPAPGKLGADHDVASGQQQARLCALNLLAQLQHALGDLRRVDQVLKLQVYVAAVPEYAEHHLVANGASDLLADVLGPAGVGARSAFGVAGLPFNSPVEVDAMIRVRP